MTSKINIAVVAYVATPHQGYINFFKEYQGSVLYVLGKELIKEFTPLVRHLPGNDPEDVLRMVRSLGIFSDVRILTLENIDEVKAFATLVMPEEDVSNELVKKFFNDSNVVLSGKWRLRWHWDSVHQKQRPQNERLVSVEEIDRELMRQAYASATLSSDWWRQIGAMLVRNGEVVLVTHNKHFPSEQSPYLYGDPRSQFGPGQFIEVSSALHAEVGILTEAAKRGIKTEGCDLYVTTFPCPPCALATANSGIRRLYYVEGYSLVEGASALESRGIEIIRVDMNDPSS